MLEITPSATPTPGRRCRARRALAFAGASALALAALPGFAAAASAPPTIASAFSPTLVGVGSVTPTALAYTITNPNTSSALSAVAFTDSLPAGLAVDNPNGLSGNCGSAGTITAGSGSQTVSLSGGSIKAGSTCSFSISVTAAQPGTFQDTPGAVSSSAGTGPPGPAASLTVLAPPTVTVSAPAAHTHLTFGRPARARFACTQPADPQALADCTAQDDQGNTINPGGLLDTKLPGAHTLTVDASSSDGLVTERVVSYTVLPDNRFTVPRPRAGRGGLLRLAITLPGPGRLRIVATTGRLTFGQSAVRVSAQGPRRLTLRPNGSGAALLKTSAGGSVRRVHLRLQVTYTPTGGVKRTVTVRGIPVG